jgi:hypothetical protein
MDATSGAGTASLPEHLSSPPVLPSVLAQAAFLSQGVDAHSSISIKCQKIDVNSAKSLKG